MVDFFMDLGFSHDLALVIARLLGAIVLATFGMVWTLFGILFERKVAGRFQDRPGPNRVGPLGLFQSFADTVKILTKENISPRGADVLMFTAAPILALATVLGLWAVVPFTPAGAWVGSDLSIGVLYLIGVGGLGTLAVLMAGWSSNNKYALLAAFRAVAQLISYEIPLVLALAVPVLLAGSLQLQAITEAQHVWFIFSVPLTAFIFLTASQAEVGRAPFDLLEAESELVAGYNIEYSGMKFGLFYVGEFLHAFTVGVLGAVFFLGGWRGPFVYEVPVLGFFYLMAKAIFVYWVTIWVRLTLPRLRIDQMLDFNWKFLVPLSLANVMVVAFVWKLVPNTDEINGFTDALVPSLALLLANIAMIAGVAAVLAGRGRRERERLQGRLLAHVASVGASVEGGETQAAGAGD